ncbi:MAG: putative ABC transporter permease [Oscillospiraceae bacterium]|nr:putative ABC transporter permease [Oscillospiraceae bacterium]
MSYWFSCFLMYSFLGYLLEKLFARVTRSERQVRKCFLLLPLCPVYGLAMVAVLLLTPAALPFWVRVVTGAVICTTVEYLVHLFYDKVFQTRFWDYSDLSGNICGRICPHFALIWGILSAAAVEYVHPLLALAASAVPPYAVFGLWMLLAFDCVLTSTLLLRRHDTELLSLSALLTQQ